VDCLPSAPPSKWCVTFTSGTACERTATIDDHGNDNSNSNSNDNGNGNDNG